LDFWQRIKLYDKKSRRRTSFHHRFDEESKTNYEKGTS